MEELVKNKNSHFTQESRTLLLTYVNIQTPTVHYYHQPDSRFYNAMATPRVKSTARPETMVGIAPRMAAFSPPWLLLPPEPLPPVPPSPVEAWSPAHWEPGPLSPGPSPAPSSKYCRSSQRSGHDLEEHSWGICPRTLRAPSGMAGRLVVSTIQCSSAVGQAAALVVDV